MSEAKIVLPPFAAAELTLLWMVLACSQVALVYGWILRQKVLQRDPGPEAMVAVARAIQEGAQAYLSRALAAGGEALLHATERVGIQVNLPLVFVGFSWAARCRFS